MKKSIVLSFLLWCVFIVVVGQSQSLQDTKGVFGVSGNGSSTYSIPVQLPPGVKNVAPQMGLIYQSGSSAGIAGYGWNISGLSTITRINSTLENDGFADNPDGDSNDRFALDGQRLLLKTGTYGQAGATYETQIHTNLKIESSGSSPYGAGYGPLSFMVTFPDGSQAKYGGTTNAISPLEYYITEWKDAQGNKISYIYTKNDNVVLPYKILWCSKDLAPTATLYTNEIQFSYKPRSRNEHSYVGDYKMLQNQLLDYISVYSGSELFRKIKLTHQTDDLGYEKVQKVTELNGNNEEANPIAFEYNESGNIIELQESYIPNAVNLQNVEASGDFDGDGAVDFISNSKFYFNAVGNNSWISIGEVPSTSGYKKTITLLDSENRLLQKNGILIIEDRLETIEQGNEFPTDVVNQHELKLKQYVYNDNGYSELIRTKTIVYPYLYPTEELCPPSPIFPIYDGSYETAKKTILEGDFNADGVSDIIIFSKAKNQVLDVNATARPASGCSWHWETSETYNYAHFIDTNPNSSSQLGSNGYFRINGINLQFDVFYVFDFNGDGKMDIVCINSTSKSVKIYTLNELNSDFVLLCEGIISEYEKDKQLVWGDYNGDGKTDLLIPVANQSSDWKMYISTGKGFEVQNYPGFFWYEPKWGPGAPSAQRVKYRQYRSTDINKDGKSDFIATEYEHWFEDGPFDWNDESSRSHFWVKENMGASGSSTQPVFGAAIYRYVFSGYGSPIYSLVGEFKNHQANTQIVFMQGDRIWKWNFSKDERQNGLLKKVTEGNGVATAIYYNKLEKNKQIEGNLLYSSGNSESYPFVGLDAQPTMDVVTKIETQGKKQYFRYHGLVLHTLGRGIVGFTMTARSNWRNASLSNPAADLWTVTRINPQLMGVTDATWVYKGTGNCFEAPTASNTTNYLSGETITFAPHNVLPYVANQVQHLLPQVKVQNDYLKNSFIQTNYLYDTYNNIQQINTNVNNLSTSTETYEYINLPNATGSNYAIGRLYKKNSQIQYDGTSFSSREEYAYTNNLVNSYKKWGNATPDFVEENYTYDGFGNVLTKTTSHNNGTQVTQLLSQTDEYDPKGRFVLTKTDPLGLITQYTYNSWGQVLTETHPNATTITNVWDTWGRLIQSTHSLSGSSTFTYVRTANKGLKTTETHTDGSSSWVEFDAEGKKLKEASKHISGVYTVKSYEYDVLGRLIKESMPYFEYGSPTRFTTYQFDILSRPKKTILPTGRQITNTYNGFTTITQNDTQTTTKIYDALGNVKTSIDEGGIIYYFYFANGNGGGMQHSLRKENGGKTI